MQKSKLWLSTVIVFPILLIAGCASDGEADGRSAADDFVTVAEPAWQIDVPRSGLPAVSGNFVATYTQDEPGSLSIVVLDGQTGAELWKDSAFPGYGLEGERLSPLWVEHADGPYVIYFVPEREPVEAGWHRVVAANGATGERLDLKNNLVWSNSRLRTCDVEGHVCFRGWLPHSEEVASLRIVLEDGELFEIEEPEVVASSRMLTDGLVATDGRAPDGVEELGHVVGSDLVWKRPYHEIFWDGASTDQGWNWDQYQDSEGIFIGQAHYEDPENIDGEDRTYDLPLRETVALEAKTGAELWRHKRAQVCLASRISSSLVHDVLPLCRFNSGTRDVHFGEDGTRELAHTNLDIDMIGVDLQTGEVRWTLPLGGDEANIVPPSNSYKEVQSAYRPISVSGKQVLANVLTGETFPLPEGGIYACGVSGIDVEYFVEGANEPLSFFAGGSTVSCDESFTRRDDNVFSVGAVKMAGVSYQDSAVIVAGPHSLALYRTS